jgi:hypothetical protein
MFGEKLSNEIKEKRAAFEAARFGVFLVRHTD